MLGSEYRLVEPGVANETRIYYECRVFSDADDLGPCRRMRVSLPNGSDLKSVEPEWVGGQYTLDFGSSVAIMASVKNFIISDSNNGTVMKMYKLSKNEFFIQVTPGGCYIEMLLPVQVFAIALSSIDRKICTQ